VHGGDPNAGNRSVVRCSGLKDHCVETDGL